MRWTMSPGLIHSFQAHWPIILSRMDEVTDPLDPTRYDDDDTPSDNVNSDLIDGLHLNSDGDQKYAAAFYKGVLDTVLSDAVAAAVPEPSSFAFMGLVALFGATVRRYRRRRA